MSGGKPVLVQMAVLREEKREWEEAMKPFVEEERVSWPPKWYSLDLQGDELFLQAEFRADLDDDLLDALAEDPPNGSTRMYVGINRYAEVSDELEALRREAALDEDTAYGEDL